MRNLLVYGISMILSFLMCGCSFGGISNSGETTNDTEEYGKTPILYEEFEMVYGEAPDRFDDPSNYQESIALYTERYPGFVGTIVPVEYRYYQQYQYRDFWKSWIQEGYI